HDHDPRLHWRPDAARRSAQGPAPRPVSGDQHRAHHDRRGAGHRAGHPRGGREAGRGGRPGAGGRRSLTDLAVVLGREATAADVNEAFAAAASGPMAGILTYRTDPIVSRDVIGDSASCVFDSPLTQAAPTHAAGTLVKVFGWYDNDWGYTWR